MGNKQAKIPTITNINAVIYIIYLQGGLLVNKHRPNNDLANFNAMYPNTGVSKQTQSANRSS